MAAQTSQEEPPTGTKFAGVSVMQA